MNQVSDCGFLEGSFHELLYTWVRCKITGGGKVPQDGKKKGEILVTCDYFCEPLRNHFSQSLFLGSNLTSQFSWTMTKSCNIILHTSNLVLLSIIIVLLDSPVIPFYNFIKIWMYTLYTSSLYPIYPLFKLTLF